MNLVYASFDLLFSELKNCSFGNELFFLLYNFIKSKDLIRIHEMILELDIKDFEFEEVLSDYGSECSDGGYIPLSRKSSFRNNNSLKSITIHRNSL